MKKQPEDGKKPFSILLAFFGIAYFCQHFGQAGLITQPLEYYFKEVLHFKADQVANFFAVLTFPWIIKPVYGLISDYFPLFGYRRKSYLLILNLLATVGFLLISKSVTPETIQIALLLTAFSTAFSDVAIDGLMVEMGNKTGDVASYQSMQWICFNTATIISSLCGGYFTEYFAKETAFHWAAIVTAIFPLILAVASWLMVKEDIAKPDKTSFKQTTEGLKLVLKSKTIWLVAGFIAFWQFSPSFGTPMYYYQTDTLKFSQSFIGQLGAIGAFSAVMGGLAFSRYLTHTSTRKLLYWSCAIGVIGTLAYLLLINPVTGSGLTAILLALVFGATAQIATLAILNLAAESCPPKVEAVTFAVLMSIYNFAGQGSTMVGAWLYENWLNHQLGWLIWISAGFTLLGGFLIPLLPKLPDD